MRTVAKFFCQNVTHYPEQVSAYLTPVSGGPNATAEDNSFWKYTPLGELKVTVSNPALTDFFVPGKAYYLTFEAANEPT